MDFQCHNRALKTSTTCSSRTKGEGAEEVELEELAAPARARIRQCSRTGRSQLAYQSVPGTSALLLIEPGDSLRVDTGSGRKGKRLCKCVIDHDTGRGWRPIFIYSRITSFVSRSISFFIFFSFSLSNLVNTLLYINYLFIIEYLMLVFY